MTEDNYLEIAKPALDYNPEDGLFRWKIKTHGMRGVINPGDIAGMVNTQGYRLVGYKGKQHRAHRLAYLFMTGEWPPHGMIIDHANQNRDDNRWANLRLATKAQNTQNGGIKSNNKSGHPGVSWVKRDNLWDARIKCNGKLHLIGRYKEKQDAIEARKKAEKELWGEWVPIKLEKARPRHK